MDRTTDKLTGLYSGADLNADMEALIAAGKELAFIAVDIDNLMTMDEQYGHEAGDAVFRLIAKHIKALFSEPCAAYRDKGDEFAILMPDSGKEEAFLKAEELRKLVCGEKLDYKSAEGKPLKQTVSMGVSSYPDDGSRPADILRRADSAMARAKKNGRNIVLLAKEEKLTPKTSHYTQAQLEKLTIISDKIGVGEATLLREALDDLLRKYDVEHVRIEKLS